MSLEETWEYEGKTYQRGDSILISGETGLFKFGWVLPNGDITVWWTGHCYRSFRPNRVMTTEPSTDPACKKHPKYKALRRPRTGCAQCLKAFKEKEHG